MKSIVRLKLALLIGVSLVYSFLPLCFTEPSSSSKGNITPVKLFHMNQNSTLFNTRKNESAFGSKAKISRVVPIKHTPKGIQTYFNNSSNMNALQHSHINTNSSLSQKYSSAIQKPPRPNLPTTQSRFESSNKNSSKSSPPPIPEKLPTPQPHLKWIDRNLSKSTSVKKSSATFATTVLPKVTKLTNKHNPLLLTSDSWNYLNSAVTDDELRQIINGLSNEVIKNVTNITKHDPAAGQNFLLKNIIKELSTLKRSRMLFDNEKKVPFTPVNKGVRFSAKQRKPILNVVPLELKKDLGKPVKNLIKTAVVEHWNISGLLSNAENNEIQSVWGPLNDTKEKKPELKSHWSSSNPTSTSFKASPIFTTPSLMQVLAVPENSSLDSTTYSPFLPNQSKMGFVPVSPTDSLPFIDTNQSLYGEKIIPKEGMHSIEEQSSSEHIHVGTSVSSVVAARKPRVPPKEDEYALPSITTTSTISPEVHKGYQTITESTTSGPKLIWYNHNQTPEDTFYPNFDNFLVPPEESSFEILTDLLSEIPGQEDSSIEKKPSSFSPSSPEYDRNNGKGKGSKNGRPILHYNSKEKDDDSIGSRKRSRFSIEKGNKSQVSLQQAGTADHDDVRDFYGDLDSKNGGSSGKNDFDHHKRQRFGPSSFNSYKSDIKHHEIIPPRHHKTNRKPFHNVEDTENYGAFNDDRHYRDSYPPPPPVVNRHETHSYRYRSYHDDSPGENEYFKEEPVRVYDIGNGHIRDDGPTTVADVYYKKEPKYRLKETSPGFGQHGYIGGDHGHGWKEPPKDFFSQAKDYFKNSDFSTAEKWFDVTIGVLAFLAFGGYIIMLLYQVFAISQGTSIGTLVGRSVQGAGEIFDLFFSKGPIGQAYLDELETIVKRAMANVKRIWVTNTFAGKKMSKDKGEVNAK